MLAGAAAKENTDAEFFLHGLLREPEQDQYKRSRI
jgi:hypothetical protein